MNLALPAFVLAARLGLCAVFAIAALTKLRDRSEVTHGLVEFGVPGRLAPAAVPTLIACEIVVAAALLFDGTAFLGALGAAALLSAFTIVVALNIARGNRPACRCFGAAEQRPIGWDTVLRNVALLALAGLIGARSGDAPLLATAGTFEFVCVLALTLVAFVLWHVVQQQGRMLVRLEALEQIAGAQAHVAAEAPPPPGLPIGFSAPEFALATVDGATASLTDFAESGGATLLLFVNPKCGPCRALRPEVVAWQNAYGSSLTIVPVSEGTPSENRESPALANVLLQREREVAEAYRVYGTPGAVLLQGGRIASHVAQGADEIRALVASFVDGRLQPALSAGDELPHLTLEDARGEAVELHALLRDETAIVFWNPQCGFCANMLDDLLAWERAGGAQETQLVIVSSLPLEAGAALRSPVLIDRSLRLGSACGATGTPMAVRVDARGRIVSQVAAGRDAVLGLLSLEPVRG